MRYFIVVFTKLEIIVSTSVLVKIYFYLLNSIASYGIIAWGSAFENAITPLVNFLKKKLMKIIFKNKKLKNILY